MAPGRSADSKNIRPGFFGKAQKHLRIQLSTLYSLTLPNPQLFSPSIRGLFHFTISLTTDTVNIIRLLFSIACVALSRDLLPDLQGAFAGHSPFAFSRRASPSNRFFPVQNGHFAPTSRDPSLPSFQSLIFFNLFFFCSTFFCNLSTSPTKPNPCRKCPSPRKLTVSVSRSRTRESVWLWLAFQRVGSP
jgi:hypothetical protein